MTTVTAQDCMMIGNVKLMVTSAAACGAQRQKHLGPKKCQMIMKMPLAEEIIR